MTFAWENEYDFHDLDGSFTETGTESHLLTESGILPTDKCSANELPDFNLGKVNKWLFYKKKLKINSAII